MLPNGFQIIVGFFFFLNTGCYRGDGLHTECDGYRVIMEFLGEDSSGAWKDYRTVTPETATRVPAPLLPSCLTLQHCRLQPARLLYPGDSPGENAGAGCHFLLQRILPTQGLNLYLLHRQAGSSPMPHPQNLKTIIPPIRLTYFLPSSFLPSIYLPSFSFFLNSDANHNGHFVQRSEWEVQKGGLFPTLKTESVFTSLGCVAVGTAMTWSLGYFPVSCLFRQLSCPKQRRTHIHTHTCMPRELLNSYHMPHIKCLIEVII